MVFKTLQIQFRCIPPTFTSPALGSPEKLQVPPQGTPQKFSNIIAKYPQKIYKTPASGSPQSYKYHPRMALKKLQISLPGSSRNVIVC
jgi:hypothetical protein